MAGKCTSVCAKLSHHGKQNHSAFAACMDDLQAVHAKLANFNITASRDAHRDTMACSWEPSVKNYQITGNQIIAFLENALLIGDHWFQFVEIKYYGGSQRLGSQV